MFAEVVKGQRGGSTTLITFSPLDSMSRIADTVFVNYDMEGAVAFREKAAWISLAVTLVVWGGYFAVVWSEIAGGRPNGALILERFMGAVVFSVVASIVTAIVLALVSGGAADAPADERERLIALKSTDVAYNVLSLGVVVVALTAPAVALGGLNLFPGDPAADTALIAANGVLFALIAAEVVRGGLTIARYRLGR